MMSSPAYGEGKRAGGTALWPRSGWLALFFRDICPFLQVPRAFWGLWGVGWTPVARASHGCSGMGLEMSWLPCQVPGLWAQLTGQQSGSAVVSVWTRGLLAWGCPTEDWME